MLMEVMQSLASAGAQVRQVPLKASRDVDAILEVTLDGEKRRFVVEVKGRAPYPNELKNLEAWRQTLSNRATPLLVAPFVSESSGNKLTEAGWSWADAHGNFDLRARAFRLRQRRVDKRPVSARRTLPKGSGSHAIIRTLISEQEEYVGATTLALHAEVTQPRVSQVLATLEQLQLVEKTRHGWRPDREALLDRFLAEYEGPGGSTLYFYSLDPSHTTAVALTAAVATLPADTSAVSADVGPDLLVPWRRPTTLTLYTRHPVDPARFGLVEAQGTPDANVIIRVPADRSVFPAKPFTVEVKGATVPLAHPTQMIWDLLDLGGDDRSEAAEELSRWLLSNH